MNFPSDRQFSHSGGIGDLIIHLSALKEIGDCRLHLFPVVRGDNVTTPLVFKALCPLLLAQPYLREVTYGPRPAGFNLDGWRSYLDVRRMNLQEAMHQWLGLPDPDPEQPWVYVDRVARQAEIVFHRSKRYRNPKADWATLCRKWYGPRETVFVGFPSEYASFELQFSPGRFGGVRYLPTADLLELAQVIQGAHLFVGNQSAPYALSVALRVPSILETYPPFDSCRFRWSGARYIEEDGKIPEPSNE